ncbi:MarP family serine protease [Jatrophihabitans sp.]|uniref:MarP family serine protease n=1 Tax=Jatrophihabitans sp. TaxID=1932789 RepID=UPI002BB1165B|nr:MarP family serine protease [Jatrophihabitans sp.]
MHGDALDLVLVALALLSALGGYRRGLICSITSFAGFVAGAAIGVRIAPAIGRAVLKAPSDAGSADQAIGQRVVILAVVFACATLGHLIGQAIGNWLRAQVHRTPFGPADGVGGAVISVVTLLALAWLLAVALAYAPAPALARQIHRSLVLNTIDRMVPGEGQRVVASLLRQLQQHDLPAVSGPFTTLLAPSVAAPDPAVVAPAIRVAGNSIVKITGEAPSCRRAIEGTGFVFARDRVMTNAHVLAGVTSPRVSAPGGGSPLASKVVLYDPNRDIAVLLVPGLNRQPLAIAGPADSGTSAVVAGYPENGPFTADPARIAGRTKVTGPNIYQDRTVTRQVYTVRGRVRPGNSGGPLLSDTGQVYGVVFAASVDQAGVGYVLTAAEVAPDLQAGRTATATVGTQGCD